MRKLAGLLWRSALGALFLAAASHSRAATEIGPWTPVFKGVEYSVSTNIPGSGSFLYRQVVHALRIDLNDPDVSFFTTPRITNNYTADVREIAAYTPSDFLKNNQLQAVINANFFSEGSYYLPAGTPMDVFGLEVSKGIVVSPPSSTHRAVLQLDANNQGFIIHTNWPAASTEGVYTAVAGNAPLVFRGENIRPRVSLTDLDPRTAFGLSEDRRYLYVAAVDGRQPGYSDGASLYETAGWMLLLGAYDAINVDGGGSTTLVIQDITGAPRRLNRSSAVANAGRERTVGSHFGIYAKPVPGFINDIVVMPEDTSAKVTWTTLEPATSEVQFGLTTGLGSSSGLDQNKVTEHEVVLSGLTPDTGYYYKIAAQTDSAQYFSSLLYFKTTNYVTTNEVFSMTNAWKYSTAFVSGWQGTNYDDSSWAGPGPALLWVDTSAAGNPEVQPKNTEMPANGSFPFITYYFRTTFNLAEMPAGSSLMFSGFIDDGAAFYLNGTRIYLLRMPQSFSSTTLANGYPCGGSATCLDEFVIPVASLPSVVAGENLLAVEVHNYNSRSPDTTFGLALSRIDPIKQEEPPPKITIGYDQGSIVISWEGYGYRLYSSPELPGEWTLVEEAVNPFLVQPTEGSRFYRLQK